MCTTLLLLYIGRMASATSYGTVEMHCHKSQECRSIVDWCVSWGSFCIWASIGEHRDWVTSLSCWLRGGSVRVCMFACVCVTACVRMYMCVFMHVSVCLWGVCTRMIQRHTEHALTQYSLYVCACVYTQHTDCLTYMTSNVMLPYYIGSLCEVFLVKRLHEWGIRGISTLD